MLSEIDNAAKLLPYLLEKDHTASVSQETEQAVRAYKVENAQLKRLALLFLVLKVCQSPRCSENLVQDTFLSGVKIIEKYFARIFS